MAPRKAATASREPKLVRRVVKTVTTEQLFGGDSGGESKRTVTTEVIEETLDGGGPLLPKVSKTIQKKSKSAGVAARRKKTASATSKASKQTSKTAAGAAKAKAKARGVTTKSEVNTNGVGTSSPLKRGASKVATPTGAAKKARTKAAATKIIAAKTEKKVSAATTPKSKSTPAGARATTTKTPSKVKSETKRVSPRFATKTKPKSKAPTSKSSTTQSQTAAESTSNAATPKRKRASAVATKATPKRNTDAPTSSTAAKAVKKQPTATKREPKLRVQSTIKKRSKREDTKRSKRVKCEVDDVVNARLLNEAYQAGMQAAQQEMNQLALEYYGVAPQQMVPPLHGACASLPSVVQAPGVAGSAGANVASGSHAASATQARASMTVAPTTRARRVKQTARKSSGMPQAAKAEAIHAGLFAPPPKSTGIKLEHVPDGARAAAPARQARRVKQTARKSTGMAINWMDAAPSASTRAARQVVANAGVQRGAKSSASGGGDFVWTLVHEQGFFPDGFHSYMEPTNRNLGEFGTRGEAVRVGKTNVGNEDYPWEDLVQGGDLQIVCDNATKWEALWSPPDSQYSRVTATRVCVARGRWLVEVEFGYPPSGFHSYVEPERKTVGTVATREAAVRKARTAMGSRWGLEWTELCETGELTVVRDETERWEARWVAGDSEYAHVLARRLAGSGA